MSVTDRILIFLLLIFSLFGGFSPSMAQSDSPSPSQVSQKKLIVMMDIKFDQKIQDQWEKKYGFSDIVKAFTVLLMDHLKNSSRFTVESNGDRQAMLSVSPQAGEPRKQVRCADYIMSGALVEFSTTTAGDEEKRTKNSLPKGKMLLRAGAVLKFTSPRNGMYVGSIHPEQEYIFNEKEPVLPKNVKSFNDREFLDSPSGKVLNKCAAEAAEKIEHMQFNE